MRRNRTVFIDLLFLLVLTMLVTMIVREPVLKSEIEQKAEYLIEMVWQDDSASDIDLWFQAPDGRRVSFQQKQNGVYSLDRDDLGQRNDIISLPDGTTRVIRLNREILTMRGWQAGTYTVNVFGYTMREDSVNVTVTWYRLNPFKVLVARTTVLTERGQEMTIASLTLDETGIVTNRSFDPVQVARAKNSPF